MSNEDDEDIFPCDKCEVRDICEAREDSEPWAYSEQFSLCCDLGEPEYHDVDWWVLREVHGGTNSPALTEEELKVLLAKVEEE